MTHRDEVTGRFARRPVPDIDAESKFDPMGDAIEDIDNVSGAPSPSTIERPRHAPAADELAQGGQWSRLRARNPRLVPDDEHAVTLYGAHVQGEIGRVAASRGPRDRIPGTDVESDPSRFLTGAEA